MATETYYQKKIMDAILKEGGQVVNGRYTKIGEADLQCGYPVNGRLLYLAVEVKTEKDYYRVMSAIKEVEGEFEIIDRSKLKEHEPMQINKINKVRKRGGLALVAWNIEQVKEYVDEQTNN